MRAARMAGLPLTFLVITTCGLAGACAGIAGAVEVVAVNGSANATLYAGLGFAGILVAFVARQHPLAIIPVAILLGGIEASGGVLQRRHDLPDAVVDVFKGILFLVILASETLVPRIEAAVEGWLEKRTAVVSAKLPVAALAAPTAPAVTSVTAVEPQQGRHTA